MWTTQQQIAIDANCADNLVSAAAGSGKTAVMVERIVDRVLSGKTDIDRLLVVTFTNAAASELKSRLMNKIMDSIDSSDNPDRLNRQLMLIGNADICTIDSFCLNILRNNFYKAGLDPSFKIADNSQLEIIKEEILNSLFEDYYNSDDEEFLRLVDCMSRKKDDDLISIIKKVKAFTDSMPHGTGELPRIRDKFCDTAKWMDLLIEQAEELCKKAMENYDMALSYCSFSDDFEKLRLFLLDEKNYFFVIKSKNNWDGIKRALDSISFDRINIPRSMDKSDAQCIKDYRDKSKAIYKELSKKFSAGHDEMLEDMHSSYKLISKITEMTEEFNRRFSVEKSKQGIVDFVDVEHKALKLLENEDGMPSDLAVRLMGKYQEIYIDEYQDCNGVQERLFSLISGANSGNPNMFMVGDMKQSIYGFRGSQPKQFKDKADAYETYTEDGKYNKIILNKNFRSRRGVIDAVNSVFSQIMSEKCGELDYTEDEFLYYNDGSYKDVNPDTDKVDLVLFETDPRFSDDDPTDEILKTEAEAMYTANRIKEIVSSGYTLYDKSKDIYRPAKYSDIVVLLRSKGEKAEIYNRILTSALIPVYCESAGEYYNSPEIVFLTNFLRIIDNPLDDIALISVMRHPLFSFCDDDFVSVRLFSAKGYFYNSIIKYIKSQSNALSEKLSGFTGRLEHYYELSRYLSADRLLWEIIKDIGYMEYLSFMPNAELKKGNVKALLIRANDFEKTSYKGIFDFIRYTDNLKRNKNDIEPARILSDDEDVVRIMTIHKSKGLEFPIVFLGDCGKKFNDNDITKEKVVMHREYGFGIDYYNSEMRYHYALPQKKVIQEVKRNELLSEEMRVLYVALTRAREKLIITASLRNAEAYIGRLSDRIKTEDQKLSPYVVSSANSYVDWILMSALRNKNSSLYDKTYAYSHVINDGSKFDITYIHKDNVVLEIESKTGTRSIEDMEEDKETTRKITEILDFSYPYACLKDIPSNMSVSELKRLENSNDDVYDYYHTVKLTSPHFLHETSKLTSAEIGTLTHLVMEKLDFEKTSEEEIKKQLETLIEKGFVNEENAKYVNIRNIAKIFETEFGKMLKNNSASAIREYSFKYLLPATEINPLASEDETIVVQGMIDIYFEDSDGSLIIADYKTDKVTDIESIKMRYAPQLKYYKTALQKSLGKRVSKTYLILLDNGQIVEC